MPYSLPAPALAVAPAVDREPPPTVRHHRRTRSSGNFSDERGPGAFVSLGTLPRSHKKAVFHINVNDDDDRDDSPRHSPTNNSLRLSMAARRSPSTEPPPRIHIPSAVPFPTSSPLSPSDPSSPFFPSGSRHPSSISTPTSRAHSPSLPRTPSTPVILSNGKPLKPSLKSSSSSPNIPAGLFPPTKHFRAQSAPSTPAGAKNVHFAEDSGLESVRVFSRSGKPASLSTPSGDETETETEAEQGSFPFPSIFSPTTPPILYETDSNPGRTSAVPTPGASPYAHVHLETLALPRVQPPALRGTVVVRNVAFEKRVVVRFTLDDWQTTSEVACHHVVSLPSLPPPFPQPRTTIGDLAGSIAAGLAPSESSEKDTRTWDRFSFTVRLEDYEHKLAERTLYLAVRYAPGSGGEFWDNNGGANYRVAFRRAPLSPASSTPSSPAHAQQRTFSAPSTLRTTPVTADAPVALARSLSFPVGSAPAEQPPARASSFPAHAQTSPAGAYVAKRLSLSNYVAPSASPPSAPASGAGADANMVTPPQTPPGSARARSASLPAGVSLRADTPTPRADAEEHAAEGILSPLEFWGGGVSEGFGAALGLGIAFPASMEGEGSVGLLSPPGSPLPPAEVENEHEHEHENDARYEMEDEQEHDFDERYEAQDVYGGRARALGLEADSSYAALIRQWCFGGVGGGVVQPNTPGHGQAQGYGFPGWGFGMVDTGMVGAHMR